jgi:hypothetical protein
MNFLFPPSRLFRFSTACAVVPDHAKESRKIASLLSLPFITIDIRYSIREVGFGLLNILLPNIETISSVPS